MPLFEKAGLSLPLSLVFKERRFQARLKAGDHAAFDALFERHAAQVLGFLLPLLNAEIVARTRDFADWRLAG